MALHGRCISPQRRDPWYPNIGGGWYPGNNSSSEPDVPWKYDTNGEIEAVTTGQTMTQNFGNVKMVFEEVILKTESTLLPEVTVYRTIDVRDLNTNNTLPLEDKYLSNCFGYALAGGDYYFLDNPNTSTDEFTELDRVLNEFFEETDANDPEAELAVVFTDDDVPYHAGRYDDGEYSAKGTYSEHNNYSSEDNFRRGEAPDGQPGYYEEGEVRYFKGKN